MAKAIEAGGPKAVKELVIPPEKATPTAKLNFIMAARRKLKDESLAKLADLLAERITQAEYDAYVADVHAPIHAAINVALYEIGTAQLDADIAAIDWATAIKDRVGGKP